MPTERPTEDQLEAWTQTLRNWGRWGPDDARGALNYITPEKRRAAAALARAGESISLARPIAYGEVDVTQPAARFMTATGERADPEGYGSASDVFFLAPHGFAKTHLDALCHTFWRGQMYGGRPAESVTVAGGAPVLGVDVLADGVVARGVLLDIPAARGVDWLEGPEPIFPEDLETAERRQGVRVESGDVLCVRTGYLTRRARLGRAPGDHLQFPGLQAACVPWLREREVAILASDTANDVMPSGYRKMAFPVHVLGIVFLGLWLIDNCNHEALAAACGRHGRWAFEFVLAPLRLTAATCSPVNPLAIF